MSAEFHNIDLYRGAITGFPHQYFRTFEKPKFYDYIPETYKMKWEDPHKFIPDRMVSQFNQKMFLNYIHRECFNSCVSDSSSLTQDEKDCYNNCKNKHLSVLGTFEKVLVQQRKWKGWKNFLNVKEFSRTPEEIGTTYPTDPAKRAELVDKKEREFMNKQTLGLREALNSEFEETKEERTIFDVYMKGEYTYDSKVGKERLSKRRNDIYNEYKELNEKYGAQVAEMLKSKVNLKDWKDIPGDEWVPEEEPVTSEAPSDAGASEPQDE